MKLKIADNLSLPLETVTQSMGIIAKRRAGKSYAMRRLVEQLLTAKQQVVIIDPKGDQWGVRSASDGKSPGFPVIILGGERADVPLEVNSGEIVAKLVVEECVSVLLDLSLFRKHEVATFMTGFLENLYRLKAKERYRTPVLVAMDEADAIAPQKPQKGEERMLGAAEDIVRRGGQRGIGIILVTQRAAVLNKNVLTQVQILVALRTIAPQDLDAMKAWIDVHGTAEQQKTLMDSLPALPTGDAWFWSPGWPDAEGIFQRVHILPIETFDSGATPRPGEKRVEPKKAAEVDLDALRRQMAATIERAKQTDPRELHKKIRELENKLKSPRPQVDEKTVARAMENAKREAQREVFARIKILEATIARQQAAMKRAADLLVGVAVVVPSHVPAPVIVERGLGTRALPWREKIPVPVREGEANLRLGARRMLAALVQWSPEGMSEGQMRSHAGLKNSGTFSAYKTDLRAFGFMEERNGLLYATQGGIDWLGHDVPSPSNTEEVLAIWMPKLRSGARRMLEILAREYPGQALTDEELQEKAGLTKSGTYSAYKTDLKTARLIVVGRGSVQADKDTLFL